MPGIGGVVLTTKTTETRIGNTIYIVTAECSSKATETVEQKLERMICRHISDSNKSPAKWPNPLAMFEKES